VTQKTKIGRNDPCFCGSGKKYKYCHEAKAHDSRSTKLWMFALAGLVAAAVIIAVTSATRQDSTPARVWSAEHGHWHDVQ
jgi:hypothetical protein